MKNQNRGKQLFANQMHREMFVLVFCASMIPTLITAVSLFYLIFNITAEQVGIPESIAHNIIPAARKVLAIIVVATPIVIAAILVLAHKITHKIVGPFDRIVRELEECINGVRQGPIKLRGKDKFVPLVDRINILLEKLNGR